MKFTNRDKQERGEKGETDITAALKAANLWNHKFINAGYGTVFDKLVIPPGGGYALEIKVRQKPNIAYNVKSITENERKGLTKFMNQVGQNHAFILGIWKTEKEERAFLIPWHMVRDPVCSGIRGSINMLDFPEVYKKNGVWDLWWFKKTREEG